MYCRATLLAPMSPHPVKFWATGLRFWVLRLSGSANSCLTSHDWLLVHHEIWRRVQLEHLLRLQQGLVLIIKELDSGELGQFFVGVEPVTFLLTDRIAESVEIEDE